MGQLIVLQTFFFHAALGEVVVGDSFNASVLANSLEKEHVSLLQQRNHNHDHHSHHGSHYDHQGEQCKLGVEAFPSATTLLPFRSLRSNLGEFESDCCLLSSDQLTTACETMPPETSSLPPFFLKGAERGGRAADQLLGDSGRAPMSSWRGLVLFHVLYISQLSKENLVCVFYLPYGEIFPRANSCFWNGRTCTPPPQTVFFL